MREIVLVQMPWTRGREQMTTLFDLLDGEVVLHDEKPPPVPYEPPVRKPSHVDRNLMYLEEHLTFAVPLRMRELRRMSENHPNTRAGDTWQESLLMWFRWPRERKRTYGIDRADKTMQVATQGDLLFSVEGQHKDAGLIAAALVDGLATGALINPDGITYRGLHWCTTHCPKQPKQPPPKEWKQQFDAILDDLLEKL